jgi:hypothetical protein
MKLLLVFDNSKGLPNFGDEASMVMHWTVNPAPTARLVRSQ